MRATITAVLVLLLTSQTARAATERYSCVQGSDAPTIFEVDRIARTFLTTEGGQAQIDQQPVCSAFEKVTGEAVRNLQSICTVAFDRNVVAADYVVAGGSAANVMIALDSSALRLTTIVRLGTTTAAIETLPCKRL